MLRLKWQDSNKWDLHMEKALLDGWQNLVGLESQRYLLPRPVSNQNPSPKLRNP